MVDDNTISTLSKISGIAGRKGLVTQSIISGIVLLVIHLIQISNPAAANDGITNTISNIFIFYAVANLFALSYLVVKQPFTTPEVKAVKCHFCNAIMTTATLICENCSSTSNKGK